MDAISDTLISSIYSTLPLLIFPVVLVLLKALADFLRNRKEDTWREEIEQDENRVAQELNKTDQTDFGTLWVATQKRIGYYHRIATSQARNSFISSQLAIVAGFILLVVFGIIAAQATTAVGAISAGAVGVVGAALSAYIGATFMKAQSEASAQLREFFNQPVEFARLLGAERLIESMDEQHKSETVRQLVMSIMPSSTLSTSEKKESPSS